MVSMHSGPNSWVYGAGAANGMLEIESRASRSNGGSDSLVSTLGLHGYIGSSFSTRRILQAKLYWSGTHRGW